MRAFLLAGVCAHDQRALFTAGPAFRGAAGLDQLDQYVAQPFAYEQLDQYSTVATWGPPGYVREPQSPVYVYEQAQGTNDSWFERSVVLLLGFSLGYVVKNKLNLAVVSTHGENASWGDPSWRRTYNGKPHSLDLPEPAVHKTFWKYGKRNIIIHEAKA
jgi:hypothetical protein